MGNGSLTPCAMTRKNDRYQHLASGQARINGRLLRLPLDGNHIRHLSATADHMIAANGGSIPDHWNNLSGVLKGVVIAKGSTDPHDENRSNI